MSSTLNAETSKIRRSLKTNLRYEEEYRDVGYGILTIFGLHLPSIQSRFFDPLAKIWSSVRKRNEEMYQISTTATFLCDQDTPTIICQFYLNYAGVEDASRKEAEERFKQTFHLQLLLLEEVLDNFVLDQENGYPAYCEYLEQSIGDSEAVISKNCDDMLQRFLMSINVKTEEDERKKAKRKSSLEG